MEDVWDSFPLYIGYKDIMKLGFKKYRIYEWFNCESFPEMVRKGGTGKENLSVSECFRHTLSQLLLSGNGAAEGI